MADFMVGRSGGKDRYMVGTTGATPYKVGGGGSAIGQSSNKQLGGGDQASPAGAKSAFSYSDPNTKDIGDQSENMNFGGSVGGGVMPAAGITLEYSEKGDWAQSKDAMARRKAMMEAAKKYNSGDGYNSPTADIVKL